MNESIYNQTQVRQWRQPERLALFVVFTDMTKEDWIMGRIENHPILGPSPEGKTVTFYYNGTPMEGLEGEPIMAALKVNGVMVHRYTAKTHEPRGVFCAIGRCTDCVMIVDGKPNVRTCITPLKEGMKVETQYGVSSKEA